MWYHGPMSIERINPGELARPSGFSHAVSATGGRLVFLAGQTGYGPDGAIVDGGLVRQFEQALGNLLAAGSAAGSTQRWPPSELPGCGTPMRSSRYKASPSWGQPAEPVNLKAAQSVPP